MKLPHCVIMYHHMSYPYTNFSYHHSLSNIITAIQKIFEKGVFWRSPQLGINMYDLPCRGQAAPATFVCFKFRPSMRSILILAGQSR